MGIKISEIRERRKGGVLIELSAKPEEKSKFSEALQTAVGEKGRVRLLVPTAQVFIWDLYTTTEKEEVRGTLETLLGIDTGNDWKI